MEKDRGVHLKGKRFPGGFSEKREKTIYDVQANGHILNSRTLRKK